MVQSRDASLTKSSHRTVANLLDANKPDSALIRVESIIRSDILTELHEILELYCELLLARFPLLDSSSPSSPNHNGSGGQHGVAGFDPGREEAVKSLIYAPPRTEIKELAVLRNLLAEKFGKEFVMKAAEGVAGGVSDKVVRRLSVEPPKEALVRGYLTEIARAYGVEWPKGKVAEDLGVEEIDLLVDTGDGDGAGAGDGGGGSGADALEDLKFLDESPHAQSSSGKSDVKPRASMAARPGPSPPKAAEAKPLPKPPQASKQAAPPPPPSADSGVPDLTELERRFAALKKLG